ncbi:hypothetical protein ACS0TY_018151 [Phlomoides rotata]
MAAPPLKSQPLHNFSLSHLKWARKNSSPSSSHHHRFRRRDSPDQHRRSYPDPELEPTNPKQNDDSGCAVAEEENGEAKRLKLRPRKEVSKTASCPKSGAANNDCKNNGVKSQRIRGTVDGGHRNDCERKLKRRLWISLSKEEIEEDVYALTGGKPARRPRKWPKNVQKQLDNVFPGLYLVGVSADSYRVMML